MLRKKVLKIHNPVTKYGTPDARIVPRCSYIESVNSKNITFLRENEDTAK